MRRGSPTFSISGIVHLRSKALERTILKIYVDYVLVRCKGSLRIKYGEGKGMIGITMVSDGPFER